MLSVAWERFCERPYEQVRLADIAGDAGVTVPTLYSRFGTKEDLFVAAWRWFARPQGVRRDGVAVGDLRAGICALSLGRGSETALPLRARAHVCGELRLAQYDGGRYVPHAVLPVFEVRGPGPGGQGARTRTPGATRWTGVSPSVRTSAYSQRPRRPAASKPCAVKVGSSTISSG